jgi:predicted PurR-regulated permease PerM
MLYIKVVAEADMKDKYLKQIRNGLYVILTLGILIICKVTSSVSINLILSVFIFLMMLPFVTALERIHVKGFIATIIAILLIIIIVTGVVWFILYTVNQLIGIIPAYTHRINFLDAYLVDAIRHLRDVEDADSIIKLFNIDWASTLMPILRSVSASAIQIAKNAVVTILLAVFLLLERHTIVPKMAAASQNRDNPEKVSLMLDRINRQVSKYLGTKFILSLITGLLFYATALIAHLDLAFLWGVLAVLLNFIPTFGSIIVTAITILMAVLQYLPNWTPILIVAVGTITTQMVVGNILDPRVQGNQLNLSPFVILVSLSIFGYVWGIVGMFLAVPIISILQIVFANMDSTRGIAIIMSSGSSLKRRMKAETKGRKHVEYDDVLFPQEKTT